jgi:hypothetical protein
MSKSSKLRRAEKRRKEREDMVYDTEEPAEKFYPPDLPKERARMLRFELVNDITLIPVELLQAVPDIRYPLQTYMDMCALCLQDPLHVLYGMYNDKDECKGVLWFNINPILQNIFITTYSVDPEYRGGAIKYGLELVQKYHARFGFTGPIQWSTSQPEIFEKAGMKRSKHVLMEA